jgi:hypothetical protein
VADLLAWIGRDYLIRTAIDSLVSDNASRSGRLTPELVPNFGGDHFPGTIAPRPVTMTSPKQITNDSLRGFAKVKLPIGLKLIDCSILVGSNGPWTSLPSKPVLYREGRHIKLDGKPQFAPVLEWPSRDLADRFSAAVVAMVRAAHPEALGILD